MCKKHAALALLICLTVVLLCGCAQEQTTYPEAGTAPAPTQQAVRQADVLSQPTDAPQVVVEFPEDYDPNAESEEEDVSEEEDTDTGFYGRVVVNSKYAGATPIPLDPVDMPTPTPRPDLEFEYEKFTTAMGYTLDVPVGWLVDQNDANAFVVRDPEMRDNANAVFSLTRQGVSASYRVNDLKAELTNQLNQIQRNYVGWRIWQADKRSLLKSDGYYNAYRGVTYDDTLVRGIVHVALVNRDVVTLSFSAPGYYNTSYQRVYNKMRNTIQ